MDEGRSFGQPLRLPTSSDGNLLTKKSPRNLAFDKGPPASARSTSTSITAPGTARGFAGEDKQKEKRRLQDMVKEFAKQAVQGQPCHCLPAVEKPADMRPSAATAPRPAQYVLDKALRTFIVRSQDGNAMSIAMERIVDIVKHIRDTPFAGLAGLPPPHLLSGEELAKRFICIRYEAEDSSGPQHLALLMPNQHERERFYTCMKILRWALDAKRERS